MNSNLVYWLWVTSAYGVANPAKWNFLANYDSVEAAYNAVANGDFTHVLPEHRNALKRTSLDDAEKLLEYLEKNNISACGLDDPVYPQRIKEIYNPPSVLFYQGDISLVDSSVVVTCVGTRNPSDYSVKVCSSICSDLAQAGVVIASGFQVGLDSLAHNSALQAGGKTIAVLPCGIMYDYPKANAKAKKLIANHGLVLSEMFPEDKPQSHLFRARNRILSGVGLGTLVLQAGIGSGSLSTAGYALSQGKDIFCVVPHDVTDKSYLGVVNLIRDGAIPVFDARDVLNEYYSAYSRKLKLGEVFAFKTDSPLFEGDNQATETKRESEPKITPEPKPKKEPKTKPVRRNGDETEILDKLTDDQKIVYRFLRDSGETHLETIMEKLGDTVSDVESVITDMEIDGILNSLPGNRFSVNQ